MQLQEISRVASNKERIGVPMTATNEIRTCYGEQNSWYELVAGHLQTLIPKAGVEDVSAQLYRAYALICRASLGCQVEPGTRSSG